MSDDSITTGYKAIVLDAAQEMQRNENWYKCFEYRRSGDSEWITCTEVYNPLRGNDWGMWVFRRRDNTITVTIPLPISALQWSSLQDWAFTLKFDTKENCDKALTAVKAALQKE